MWMLEDFNWKACLRSCREHLLAHSKYTDALMLSRHARMGPPREEDMLMEIYQT
jgi:hypothetical protein